ncbi:MAG: PilZ domain-containing protein [Deltaproteobacteria bacterium]|nr:PilZ domain-containing protein [Deltaproteobacteria bacterium]
MAEIEIIQEDAAKRQLLEEINGNRLPVQVSVVGGNFTGMTHVNAVRQRRGGLYFRTMSMQSYEAAIGNKKDWRSRFEFYGKDNIQYNFQTAGWKTGRDGIWHRFPDFIERRQRRKFFRLEIPFQKNLFLTMGSGRYKMTAIDVSLGGIFVEFTGAGKMEGGGPSWEVGDRFQNLLLEADFDGSTRHIRIKEGILRRSEKDALSENYKYAFEFFEMEKSEKSALVNVVYDLQRKVLKERIRLNA